MRGVRGVDIIICPGVKAQESDAAVEGFRLAVAHNPPGAADHVSRFVMAGWTSFCSPDNRVFLAAYDPSGTLCVYPNNIRSEIGASGFRKVTSIALGMVHDVDLQRGEAVTLAARVSGISGQPPVYQLEIVRQSLATIFS
jgi:hypothetical protein